MNGVIDFTTPEVVRRLLAEHPEVTTIVMIDVPGSADDPENIEAARMVREKGLTTVVPSNGVIASGGVDFFLAGEVRIIEPCAKLGVHDWEDEDANDVTVRGLDMPRDHPMHVKFLDYYRDMRIPEDFYWYTLEVAPPERIHWMSDEEIQSTKWRPSQDPVATSRKISSSIATAFSMSATSMHSSVECSFWAPMPTTAISIRWLL